MKEDIRWKHRFESFSDALNKLREALKNTKNPSDL